MRSSRIHSSMVFALTCSEVKAPVLLWGPYLWTDGVKGRKSDGLVCVPEDLRRDGMHPSESGCRKVAEQLFAFFSIDPTAKAWFLSRP